MTLAQIQALGTSASPRIIWATDAQAFYSIAAGSGGGSATNMSSLPKVYAALLSQSGSDAPVATVLQNTLGGILVWSYNAAGDYTAALSGAFPAGKAPQLTSFIDATADGAVVVIRRSNDNELNVVSWNAPGDSKVDGLLNSTFIEIRVYP